MADHLAADFDQLLPQTGSRAPQKTDRARPVAHFQRGKVPLFLISLEAGGTGINLTAADTVIHCDPLWNPAVEDQATDCPPHRPGQAALCLQARRPGHSRRAHAPIAAAQESPRRGYLRGRRVMPRPRAKRPISSASSSRWGDLFSCRRQAADLGNGLDRAVRPDPVGHDDGEQQQPDRERERRCPTAGAVEDPAECDR